MPRWGSGCACQLPLLRRQRESASSWPVTNDNDGPMLVARLLHDAIMQSQFDFRTAMKTFLVAGSEPGVMLAGEHARCLHTREPPSSLRLPFA